MTPITILLAILGGLCSAATVVGSLLKPLAPYLVLVGMGFLLCLVLSHEGCSCRRQREPRPPRRRSLDPFIGTQEFNGAQTPRDCGPGGSAYKETNR